MEKKCVACQSERLDDIFLLGSNIFAESKAYGRDLGQTIVDARACLNCGFINLWIPKEYYD